MNLTYLINKLTEIRDQVGDLPAEVLYAGPITAICVSSNKVAFEFAMEIEDGKSRWAKWEAMFTLANIEVLNSWEIPNQCWPQAYMKLRAENPWWLIQVPQGIIQIGWRKRVISIDWSGTSFRGIITEDNVTKSDTMVHAWSEEKAIEYLKALKEHIS